MISLKVLDNGIFYLTIKDTIYYDAVICFFNEFLAIESAPEEFKVICDFRQAEIKLTKNEINIISRKADAIATRFKSVHTAILVDKPDLKAKAILFALNSIRSHSVRKIFSTDEAALNWLESKAK